MADQGYVVQTREIVGGGWRTWWRTTENDEDHAVWAYDRFLGGPWSAGTYLKLAGCNLARVVPCVPVEPEVEL